MLVLSRKANESIIIGDDIVITINEIKDGKARIGITAPDHVLVLRGELVVDNYQNRTERGKQ